jgi:hypothetical protein
MILYGEGGTGKSKVIQTVSDAFEQAGAYFIQHNVNQSHQVIRTGAHHTLVKSAFTGVAASLIGGKTTHNIAFISLSSRNRLGDETRLKLQAFWKDKKYLIIDKFSMISKSFLAKMAKNISIGKQTLETDEDGLSFGGLNVILCGDLHQFPPVAKGNRDHLFRPTDPNRDLKECQIGRAIYEQFNTVVILKEQKRVTDPVWH